MFDFWENRIDDTFLRDEMLRWKNRHPLEILDELVCEVLDTRDTIQSVTEKFQADNRFTG